jgi:hypothetical protein
MIYPFIPSFRLLFPCFPFYSHTFPFIPLFCLLFPYSPFYSPILPFIPFYSLLHEGVTQVGMHMDWENLSVSKSGPVWFSARILHNRNRIISM